MPRPPVADAPQASLFLPAPLPVAALDDRGCLACLRLIRSENVGPVTFRELINHYGGAEEALAALPEISRRAGRGRALKLCAREVAEAELEAAAKVGAVPVFTIEPGYPARLAEVDVPPPLLYVKGRMDLLARPMLAIVGSRDASAAGIKLTGMLSVDLGRAGFVIASGLARGIDGAAHRAAIGCGTVAVLAGGIEVIYPPEHARLYVEIAERGCLITEMAPGYKPRAQDFPRRNRIISGISLGVIIVEAAKRSGTLVTARYAGEQGREVFVIPGHPLDPRAEGTNGLIKAGATLVTTAADILEVLGPITGERPLWNLSENRAENLGRPIAKLQTEAAVGPPFSGSPSASPDMVVDADRDRIAAALGPHPVDIDALVRATGLPIRAVQIALMELDLSGRIERHGAQLVSLKSASPD